MIAALVRAESGQQTYGLDYFYNSQHSRSEKGLERSALALVDVDYNTAYHFSSRQTPKLDDPKETRVDPIHIDIIGVRFHLVDTVTLEVTMDRAHTLNDLFQLLESQGIQVRSMRNKSNRLEELFLKMVEKNLEGTTP